jgi:hypothetical protein
MSRFLFGLAPLDSQGIVGGTLVTTILPGVILADKQNFTPVINAIPGQRFNALWQQVLYRFNPGSTPHQFASKADILAAAKTGEIRSGQ